MQASASTQSTWMIRIFYLRANDTYVRVTIFLFQEEQKGAKT